MGPDDYAAHGLYDAAAPDPQRLELLDFLVSQGLTLDEIAASERQGRLSSILTDRLAGAPSLSLNDLAQRSGLDPELLARVWAAAGFPTPEPDAVAFSESDAEALITFGLGAGIFGEGPALQLVRVIGSSLARIAEAQFSAALANVPGAWSRTATSAVDAAHTSASLLSLVPVAEKAIGQLLRRHIVTANVRLEEMQLSSSSAELLDGAVGFADLTSSTRLSVELSREGYSEAMLQFEGLTTDLVTAGGGRAVKLIGDEVMFIAATARAACRIGFTLVRAFQQHPVLPTLRVGVAAGRVVGRDGDYYGPVVNLASRLVDIASPGALLVPKDVADAVAGDGYVVEALGPRTIEGFSDPVEVVRLSMSPPSGAG